MIIDADDYLEHFGVKGMHWGVHHQIKREANQDVKNYKQLTRDRSKGIVERRKQAQEVIKNKSLENPVYAKAAKKKMRQNLSLETKVRLAGIAFAGATYIVTHPKFKKMLVSVATVAGKVHRRATESKVDSFLRKNASTYVGDFIDVNNGFPALMKGR